MNRAKKLFITGAMLAAITATSLTAFAAVPGDSPAEILANLTGKSTTEIQDQRSSEHKGFGKMAQEAGVGDAFNAAMSDRHKEHLAQKVADGTLTQEQAETMQQRHQMGVNGSGMGMHNGMGNKHGNGCRENSDTAGTCGPTDCPKA